MAVHGSIDHRILGGGQNNGTRQPINELFTVLYNFLTSSYAQSAGVQRVAYNSGSQATGMGFWDSGQTSGENAWACFKFASASIPFYMLIQYSNYDTSNGINGQTLGAFPGNPGVINGTGWSSGLGIAFAMDDNGGNVWNGTTLNNGNDIKGFPVWVSSSITGTLFTFPRANSDGGTYATNREDLAGFGYNSYNDVNSIKCSGARAHFLLDQNNFLALLDVAYVGSYYATYFGKYDMRPDITSSLPPYVMISTTNPSNPMPATGVGTIYGPVNGNNSNADGGVVFPILGGSPNATQGVKGVSIDVVSSFLLDARWHPNGGFNPAKYDLYPPFLAIQESPLFGFVGRINFWNYCFGLPSQATDSTKTRAVFGSGNQASAKMLVPWDGVSSPGQGADRLGRQF